MPLPHSLGASFHLLSRACTFSCGSTQQFLNSFFVASQFQTPLLPTSRARWIGSFFSSFRVRRPLPIHLSNLSKPVPRRRPRSHRRARQVQRLFSDSRESLGLSPFLCTLDLVKFHTRALPKANVHRVPCKDRKRRAVKRGSSGEGSSLEISMKSGRSLKPHKKAAVTSKSIFLKFFTILTWQLPVEAGPQRQLRRSRTPSSACRHSCHS